MSGGKHELVAVGREVAYEVVASLDDLVRHRVEIADLVIHRGAF